MQEYKGSDLKKIRLERNIPLEQIANETRIRLSILQDLEDDAYSELSSTTQIKGFLRIYAQYLGVKPDLPTPEPSVIPPFEDTAAGNPVNPSPEEVRTPPRQEQTSAPRKADLSAPDSPSAPPAEEAPDSESSKLLAAIGRELAARRRYLNIGWEIIHDEINIPKAQLQILERGELDALTNPMQYKGLLQTYARFLNLDVESVMIRFADALQKRRMENTVTKLRRRKSGKILSPFLVTLKRFFTLDLFFGSLLILGILGFLVWGIGRMSAATQQPKTTGTLPAVAEILLSEPTESAPSPIEPTANTEAQIIPTVTPFFTGVVSDKPIEVVLLARQNVWLRVTADGKVVFQGRMADGTVRTFTASDKLELETGNVIALEVLFNQDQLEPFSDHLGAAAKIIFTVEGIQELPVVSAEMQATPTPMIGNIP